MSEDFPEFGWESEYQYKCRVYKIRQYTLSLGHLSATALANVWANCHFLGCSYPPSVMESIKHWDPPPRDDQFEEKLAEVQQLEKDAMFDETSVNLDLKLSKLHFRLYKSVFEQEPPAVVLFYNSAQACKVPCSFVENVGTTESGEKRVSLFLNDIHVSDGRALSYKDAKHACAENALKYLKKKGLVIISPNDIEEDAISKISKASLTDQGSRLREHEDNKIEDDNVGCKLLKAMGWTGDKGLGKDGQGMINPLSGVGQLNRGGLGSLNSEAGICKQSVQEQLLVFLRNPDLMKLEFSSELDNLERKMIHQLSGKFGLKHKSKGSGVNRKLVVWKEERSVSEFLDEPVTELEEEEEPVTELEEEEELVTELEVEEEDAMHVQIEEGLETRYFHSLSLNPDHIVAGECDHTVPVHFDHVQSGKRKKPTLTTQTKNKVSKTANVHFDYTGQERVAGHSRERGRRGGGGGPPRNEEGRGEPPRNEEGRGRGGGGRGGGGRPPRNEDGRGHHSSRGPFRDGYVDPYLAGPPRDRIADFEESRRRVDYQSPPPPPPRWVPRTLGRVRGGGGGGGGGGHVSFRGRDPRTHHLSGFGIYRHIKPQR